MQNGDRGTFDRLVKVSPSNNSTPVQGNPHRDTVVTISSRPPCTHLIPSTCTHVHVHDSLSHSKVKLHVLALRPNPANAEICIIHAWVHCHSNMHTLLW